MDHLEKLFSDSLLQRDNKNLLVSTIYQAARAATSRDLIGVVEFLLDKADINARDIVKNTALHLAVPYPEVIGRLLQHEPELSPLNSAGETPLHLAVKHHHIRTVELLVKKDRELVHLADNDGLTPLHYSIKDNFDDSLFEFLCLEGGPGFDHLCYRRNPLIFFALENSNLAAFRSLLEKKPDFGAARLLDDPSALHVAAKIGQIEFVDELFKASYDVEVNGLAKGGITPLHYASESGNCAVVTKLLEHHADVNAMDVNGVTALSRAAWRGNIDMVKCLLNANADPNIRNLDGSAPLDGGADCATVVEALLSHGAEIDHVDHRGWSALMCAVYWENLESTNVLLRWRAEVEIVDQDGQTALHLAVQNPNPVFSQLLLEAGASSDAAANTRETPLHRAVMYGTDESRVAKVKQLLKYSAIINARDKDGNTPLHYVALLGSDLNLLIKTIVEHYRKNGYSIDERNDDQQTPLHRALVSGSYYMAKFFIDQGAKIFEQDRPSYLEKAATGPESKQKVEYLLKTGQWTLDDKVGAFMMALKTDRDTARVIAEDDKRISQLENDTFTVLDQCLHDGKYDEAEVFLRLGANPFHRHPGQLSPFQRAYSSEKSHPFFNACVEKLDGDCKDQHALFQALRLGFEKSRPDLSSNIDRWNSKFTERTITDQYGWIIHHFTLQNSQNFSNDDLTAEYDSSTVRQGPTRLTVPSHWTLGEEVRQDEGLLEFEDETIHYYGTSTASVRGDRPFLPRECGGVDFYFETEILVRGRRNNAALTVGIGLCGEFVDMSDGFPGWLAMAPSTGYHGDDGLMHDFELTHPDSTPRPFGAEDTVGCGIDWDQGEDKNVYDTPKMLSCRVYAKESLHGEGELWGEDF
ncbi:ankyrin repeat-containing domain protein [Xylaria flabelliformis]|nr:ankyrin repeat-containing domain protein [Xylaria flabelliformis]